MAQASSGLAKNDNRLQGELVTGDEQGADGVSGIGEAWNWFDNPKADPGSYDGEARVDSVGSVAKWDAQYGRWVSGNQWDYMDKRRQEDERAQREKDTPKPVSPVKPPQYVEGDVRTDYRGQELVYHNGRWIDSRGWKDSRDVPHPFPPRFDDDLPPPNDSVDDIMVSDPDDDPVDPDSHGPIDTVPDSWGPGIRRNPEEIDLNPSSDISSIDVNPIGGIVGYNYLGPFTDVKRNIAANVQPANKLDAVAKVHDIAYQKISDLYKNYKISYGEASFMVREADAEFIKSALWLWYDPVAQYSATGIALKNIYEAAIGTRLFVGLRRSGRRRSGLGIGAGMSSNSYTPRVGVRSNSYTPGFRGASRRVPAFDNDRDRNYIPDVFDSYFPRRRRRYY